MASFGTGTGTAAAGGGAEWDVLAENADISGIAGYWLDWDDYLNAGYRYFDIYVHAVVPGGHELRISSSGQRSQWQEMGPGSASNQWDNPTENYISVGQSKVALGDYNFEDEIHARLSVEMFLKASTNRWYGTMETTADATRRGLISRSLTRWVSETNQPYFILASYKVGGGDDFLAGSKVTVKGRKS